MCKKSFVIVTLLLIIFLLGCSGSTESDVVSDNSEANDSLMQIRLPMGYIPNVQYAPFYVAAEKGFFRDAGLEINFDYSYETDGLSLVGANELPFALVSGEQVLIAREQEIPVVYVMSWWQDYPVGITSMATESILSPEDLIGKRVGIPGLFGASYVGLRALLDSAGLDEEDISLESIGFNQVEALVTGQNDAVVIYVVNEPVQLEEMGYEVNNLRVADYVHLASNGIITNEMMIEDNPALVKKFVQAALRGVAYTIENPEEAYEISKNYVEGLDDADKDVQLEILLQSIRFWASDRLGYIDINAWNNMHDVLLKMGLISAQQDVEKSFTNQFIDE